MTQHMLITHLLVFAAALPFQVALVPLNRAKGWFSPGEIRFWTVAIFVIAELVYLAHS